MAMRYVVTDDFVAAHGWTPDETAKALMKPLARVGVLVERARGFGHGGFQSPGLPPDSFRTKKAEVIQIVRQVLDRRPPAGINRLTHAPRLNGMAATLSAASQHRRELQPASAAESSEL